MALASQLKEKLGFAGWRIEILFSENGINHGKVEYNLKGREATIVLDFNDPLPEIKRTLIHEFLHIVLTEKYDPIFQAYENILRSVIHQTNEIICRRVENLAEECDDTT